MIQVGAELDGYCGGIFGRDSYGIKVVEGVGRDWVILREDDGRILLFEGDPEDLETHARSPLRRGGYRGPND